MDRPTIEVYERSAATYADRRGVPRPDRVTAFARAVDDGCSVSSGYGGPGGGRRRLDLGCGPGHYLPLLGGPAFGLDATAAMVRLAAMAAPGVPVAQGDLAHLPFGRHMFGGVWASKAHQHLPAAELPMALAEVHRVLAIGGRLDLTVFATPPAGATFEQVTDAESGDDLPGRLFTWWQPDQLADVVAAAGFSVEALHLVPVRDQDRHPRIEIVAVAERALPDHVGAGMRLLCCGLNPSLHAADAGVGYVTGSNRFWRALAAAELATGDRDARHLLHQDRIGMTDLVKRPTARADEVTGDEYRAGIGRLDRLCAWLRPKAVAVVGLAGWRAAVDRRATVGWQTRSLGGSPVYVLPSTSGLNARIPLAALADHLRRAATGPD
ncbi:MAG: methyltransferase domain-containing protein [Acidimicrobiales bacterium]